MSMDQATHLLEYFRTREQEMCDFLQRLVLAESPSDAPEAQLPVFIALEEALSEAGYVAEHIPGKSSGGCLYARPAERLRGRPVQLLLGHTDTVWPVGTLERMPLRLKQRALHGPGVYDMKGGLAQMVYALRALRDFGLQPAVTPVVLVNSDEEIGSPESTRLIRRLARIADRAFVLEPSLGPSGKLKVARKGGGRFNVVVRGKAAHAGLAPENGASAIVELAHVIQKLHALNDAQRGINVNVGMIRGGLRPNVVAPVSRAVVDVRVPTQSDATRIRRSILDLTPETQGVSLKITGRIGRPPMEFTPRNKVLWEMAEEAGRRLGLTLEAGCAGGASDGNTTSQYTATLDGLGATGDGAHARHEFIDLDRMIERTALLVLLLLSGPLAAAG